MKTRTIEAVAALRGRMANLRHGGCLPSARRLCGETGFSRFIMDRACRELVAQGVLVRKGYKLAIGAEAPGRLAVTGEIRVLSYTEDFSRVAGRILAERGVRHRADELSYLKHRNPVPFLGKVFAEKPAGVILWMPGWMEELAPLLEKEKTPVVVCADAAPPGLPFPTAGVDILRGTETAMRHLFEQGHREIAFFSGFQSSTFYRELAERFQKVCRDLGLPALEIGSF